MFFVHGGHIGSHFETSSRGRSRDRAHIPLRVKIRCRLAGVGEYTHAQGHAHTQDTEKSPELTPHEPL